MGKTSNRLRSIIIALTIFVVLFGGVYSLLATKCDVAGEIRTYSRLRPDAFYVGEKYCPQTWKLPTKKIEEIKGEGQRKIEILSPKEDSALESVLKENYLGFNKYGAGDGKSSFYIYETICTACELTK